MRTTMIIFALVMLCGGAAAQKNILLVIADDLGVDRVAAYAEHPDPGNTPTLDALAANGVLFRNATANPVCSSSRATILTGRYGFRTGASKAIPWFNGDFELPLAEISLPQALPAAYTSLAVGKWHMSTKLLSDELHPNLVGFEHFRGNPSTLLPSDDEYFGWTKIIDGVYGYQTGYITTDIIDDALDLISTTPEPWFMYLAFNQPHVPIHKPPSNLHSFGVLPDPINQNKPIHVKAMIEAMDTELGRLLATIDPAVLANTVIVFVGDNGTDVGGTTLPFLVEHAKNTLYEGGTNVPLIVSGPGVDVGTECGALVNTTDLYSTIIELAGGTNPTGTDSTAIVPCLTDPNLPSLRDWVYAEKGDPIGFGPYTKWQRSVRGSVYKLIHIEDREVLTEELYELAPDPFELNNLLAAPLLPAEQLVYDVLKGVLADLDGPWTELAAAKAGTPGKAHLGGTGQLVGGAPVTVDLTGALPNSLAILIAGLEPYGKYVYGGTLLPNIDAIMSTVTDHQGRVLNATNWPPGVPSGFKVYIQWWISDPGASSGWATSNGLRALVP